jgi:hypothetical protein
MKKFRSESDYLHAAFSARSLHGRDAAWRRSLIRLAVTSPVELPPGPRSWSRRASVISSNA